MREYWSWEGKARGKEVGAAGEDSAEDSGGPGARATGENAVWGAYGLQPEPEW